MWVMKMIFQITVFHISETSCLHWLGARACINLSRVERSCEWNSSEDATKTRLRFRSCASLKSNLYLLDHVNCSEECFASKHSPCEDLRKGPWFIRLGSAQHFALPKQFVWDEIWGRSGKKKRSPSMQLDKPFLDWVWIRVLCNTE